ncbi:MAG: adenine phosphoribosyltransferase, partial [Planctomycetaceae bacterium]|nr:adenine phosphoribosyltransferase [Planctomycetaceae bacterium]
AHPQALQATIEQLTAMVQHLGVDVIAAAEARGFIFAVPMALSLGVGFVPIRKPGKLPFNTHAFKYELEYGTDSLEMHIDGVKPGQKVLVVDDLLATGGTMAACCGLVERCGAEVVGCAFVIELESLGGRAKLEKYHPLSLIRYD